MASIVFKKQDGVVKVMKLTPALSKKLENKDEIHLCWDNCVNAYTSKCDKVADVFKKTIRHYDFITDGFQVFDEKGKLESFKVTKCKKYEEAKKK